MGILTISGSLRPESRSRALVKAVTQNLLGQAEVTTLDLRDYPLPLCDGDAAYGHENVKRLTAELQKARVILIGLPVYNFDVNAAVKNMVELTGDAWEDKCVGFLCAAGGRSSYMSVMGFANDLMLDFRCVIIPRFVYAVGTDFTDPPEIRLSNSEIEERVRQLAIEAVRFLDFSS
jgi:FMN reductase